MSRVSICTDSSALFPDGVAEQLDVTVVPIDITLDGRPFDERAADASDDFYARLGAGARATTSQPSPSAFLAAYSDAAAHGASEVLSIHLDARVSGTSGSAELAASEAPIPVQVMDTRTVSFGVGLCVRAAADAVGSGASAVEAGVLARRLAVTLDNVFVAAGVASGRVGEVADWSLLRFVDGRTVPVAPCVSAAEAAEAMAATILESRSPVCAAVGHASSTVEQGADALADLLGAGSRVAAVERYRIGPAVGAHTGPHAFGAFWWPAE